MSSENIGELVAALALAQNEFTVVTKDKTAKVESTKGGYSYRYADLGECIEAVRKPLAKQGLVVLQILVPTPNELVLKTTLAHKSGQYVDSDYPLSADFNRPQEVGKAISYARRYALCALLQIAQEDDDAASVNANPATSRQRAAMRPAPSREPVPAPVLEGSGNGAGHAEGPPDTDKAGISYILSELAFKVNDSFMAWCIKEGAEHPEMSLVKPHQLENHMGTLAIETKRIPASFIEGPDGKRNRTKLLKMLRAWHRKYPDEFMGLVHKHIDVKAAEKSAALGLFWPTDETADVAEGREPGSDDV